MTAHTRARDRLIGAVGMLLVLVIAVALLWFAVSTPAGSGSEAAPSSGTAEGAPAEAPGTLDGDAVWFADLELDAAVLVTAGSELRDVRAVGRGVLTGPEWMTAEHLTVDATVPFDVVARELGEGTEVRAGDDGQATVVRTVEALGREVGVTATGTVDVVDGRLVMEPRSIDVGGPDVLSQGIATVVRGLVTIEHEIDGLPEGLELRDVTVQDDGFRAELAGEDVVLGQ
jgi:hypothetical protein